MVVFGDKWDGYLDKIKADWQKKVSADDIVLIAGDISWAMKVDDALNDIKFFSELNGKKVMIRGNHDYWWSAIGRVRRALPEGMFAIQNDCIQLDGVLFAGTRGWTIPAGEHPDPDDVRIYQRERMRLEMSLKEARRRDAEAPLVAMMHYPPRIEFDAGFTDILARYGVSDCVYGHLHGAGLYSAIRGERDGIRYHQVSCDGLDFKMYKLPELL